MENTTTFQNCSIYRSSEFMGNVIRQDCRDITITTGLKYAQYSDATKVEYTPTGKRKRCGIWLTYRPFMVVLKAEDAIDPASMFGSSTAEDNHGLTVERSQYSSFDDRWETDFLAALASKNIQPLFQVHPEYSIEV